MAERKRTRAGRPSVLTTEQKRKVYFDNKYRRKGLGVLAREHRVSKMTVKRAIEETEALLEGDREALVKAGTKAPIPEPSAALEQLGDHDAEIQRRKDITEARALRDEGADHMRWGAKNARRKGDHRGAAQVGSWMFGRGQQVIESLSDEDKAAVEVFMDNRHQELNLSISDRPEIADQALDAALDRIAAVMGPEVEELYRTRLKLTKEGKARTPSAPASTQRGDEG